MAILYGTQSNGETLPVLVDQFGNLLAKGIEGPPGPEGPPGIGQLPPDPLEGSLLGWQDGGLAWIGGEYPLPEGTYGPFTYDGSALYLPEPAPLVYLQSIYMSDREGNEITATIETDVIGSVDGTKLSFSTNKNFQNFQVGDQVQGDQISSGAFEAIPLFNPSRPDLYPVTKEKMFDRDPANAGLTGAPEGGGPTIRWMFGETNYIDHINYQFAAVDGTADDGTPWLQTAKYATVQIMDESGNWVGAGSFGSSGGFTRADINKTAQGIQVIGRDSNLGLGCFEAWTQSQEIATQSIYSIAPDALPPYIIVSGGIWLGADGTGDPAGDTLISKTTKGLGTVESVAGNAVNLREDNKGWLDGNYVTAPAQSVGLASIARSAAIKRTTN